MQDFRLRQVHLDFHTSPDVPCVGTNFNKEEWQTALKEANIDSITVFSKCHHGYSYHPSDVNEMHPKLNFDLLNAQLQACKEINVKAPVYISAGFDEKDAVSHPEWLQRTSTDTNCNGDFLQAGFHMMCLNTAYLDKLLTEIAEVMEKYDPCGVFLDIVGERKCYCAKCRSDMKKLGLDVGNENDVELFGKMVYRNYLDKVNETVRKYSKTATIFQNSGHITRGRRDLIDTEMHLELESLPTGGWGYDHFPMSAAYARTLGKPFLGMTGKFHKTWGEFGGFKHPNALIYETSLSAAMGAGCSIGTQLHPDGKVNMATVHLIGKAYSEIKKREPWIKGAVNVSDIAVLGTEAISGVRNNDSEKADIGANRILLETHRLYDFIDMREDFSKYKLIIMPDFIVFNKELKAKTNEYLKNGGKLLLSGISGIDKYGNFAVDAGVKSGEVNTFNPNYFIPDFETVNGTTEYLMREPFHKFEVVNADIVSYGQDVYFNRSYEHFCSHQHAPNNRDYQYPTAVVNGNIAYIGWEIFSGYAIHGDFHRKELVNYVIEKLMGDNFSIDTSMPDRGVVSLKNLNECKIVHLLFAHTTNRGEGVEVIQDTVPLYDVRVCIKCNKPKKVTLVPENQDIVFQYCNGKVSFVVPKVDIHQMVCIY